MLIIEIEKIQEDGLLHEELQNIIEIILTAVNDWPEPILSLEEYVYQVQKYIKTVPSKKTIESVLKHIDILVDAWYAESLSEILHVFTGSYNAMTLEAIFNEVSQGARGQTFVRP